MSCAFLTGLSLKEVSYNEKPELMLPKIIVTFAYLVRLYGKTLSSYSGCMLLKMVFPVIGGLFKVPSLTERESFKQLCLPSETTDSSLAACRCHFYFAEVRFVWKRSHCSVASLLPAVCSVCVLCICFVAFVV